MRREYTQEQKEEICEIWKTNQYTKTQISKQLKIPYPTITKILLDAGYGCYPKGSWKRKYFVEHDYFNEINTEVKAYILGFLYADGYNNEKRGVVQVKLHKQDTDILKQINNFLQPTKELYIKGDKQYTELYINSKQISQDLAKWGCTQKKSLTLTFPKFLPEELISHFIRGYFDGDGSIYCNHKQRIFSFCMIGTKHIVESIQEYLVRKHNFTLTKISERTSKYNDNMFYILEYTGIYNVLKIKDVFYENATIFLKRKYDKFFNLPQPMRKKKR